MPKVIKFSGTPLSKTRGKGNMRIGANSHDYGTSYYSMIEPPDGGYTVYENKASGGPSIRVANNEAELINLTREASGTTYASATECLAWFATQTDKLVVSSRDSFHDIIDDGLVLELNASNIASYPGSGNTWYDLSGNGYNASKNGNPTYNSNGWWEFRNTNNDGDFEYFTLSFDEGVLKSTNTTGEWTLETLWRDMGSAYGNENIIIGRWGHHGGILQKTTGGYVYGQIRTNAGGTGQITTGTTATTDGKWMHIVLTYNNRTARFYINGELVDTDSMSTSYTVYGHNNTMAIGGYPNNSYRAYADIAKVKAYNKELSQSEIKQNYYGAVVPDNPKIVLNNKKVSSFYDNQWRQNMTGLYSNTNLPSGYISHNDLNGDFDGLTEFTYCLWLKVHNVPVGYSHSAFNKYAGTSTAVIRLYQFGTTSGQDNRFLFYGNGGGAWGNIGEGYYATNGETFFMVVQYNSTDKGQLWINGQKVGTRTGRSGTMASNTANFAIYPDNSSQVNSAVKEAYVYNHELTDQEILTLFNSTRGNHGI